MKIILLGTVASTMFNFRTDMIQYLVARQYQVYVLCVDFDENSRRKTRELGAVPVDYPLSRASMNPFADLITLLALKKLFKQIKPDVIFSYFVKPVIYGSIAGRLAGVPKRIAMLEGLGYVFTELPGGISFKQKLSRKMQVFLYRIALPFIDNLIFLNPDDPVDLLEKNGLKAKKVSVLGGIGLNLDNYPYSEAPTKPVRFIFVGRLLAEKGIFEYVAAAKLVKQRFPEAEFVVLGGLDEENPGGLKKARLEGLKSTNVIIHPGHVDNVAEWIAESSVFVLPSYYREGIPRSTQEAMAMGRAVLTTDVPGCRETVVDGVNGYFVPKWDAEGLAEKMIHLIEHPEEIKRMGRESHRIAVEKFDADIVNQKLMMLMELS